MCSGIIKTAKHRKRAVLEEYLDGKELHLEFEMVAAPDFASVVEFAAGLLDSYYCASVCKHWQKSYHAYCSWRSLDEMELSADKCCKT